MMRYFQRLLKDRCGASLAEFAILLPLFSLFTFAILEVGYLMWQFQQGAIASKQAVRIATTRSLVAAGTLPDCGVVTALPPGTLCSNVSGSDSWGPIVCNGAGVGNAACGPDIARIAQEITRFYPRATEENIEIVLSGAGLGFVGLGKPVPMVTVRFVDVEFDFIVLSGLAGFTSFTMPPLSASAPAEDMANGPS